MSKRTIGAAVAVAVVAGLTGCGAQQADEGSEAAARFAACLTAGGVEARIGEDVGGMVLVRSDDGVTTMPDGESGVSSSYSSEDVDVPEGSAALMHMGDAEGSWVAVTDADYFLTIDPVVHEVYAACEAEHPDFEQPRYDPTEDPAFQQQLAQQTEAGVAFARCARDAGFAWVADPDEADGAIALPTDLAEGEFRALLEACPAEAGSVAWMVDGELGFELWAVLEEVVGPGSGGGASVSVTRDEGE